MKKTTLPAHKTSTISLTLIANFIARKEKITNFATIDEVHFTKSQNTRNELYPPFF
ncbi:hypothetical protein HMPREF1991_02626 [Hoylesella loescheii DSM 19665 = JCM 12249 = ATCC 15930]|uniref:Uncharacterized protein n=1 Tax=Hoylesella loescheii DSM 19665 = JCM 12249 = ATCC 15930 TaxID=1122985 RepID=A0A069QEV7_HOYLO|nr:hypothetical protein HMPREF1991_02626 [Hoylesella loescheii DSM 19665 = JCM 12249 = ATCC 15930]